MKNLLFVALLLAVVGCAASHPKENTDCTRRAAMQRGLSDAASGRHRDFGRACASSGALREVYREAYESNLPEAAPEAQPSGRLTDGYGLTAGAGKEWVCEVEGAQKIFTGIGESREEASVAAVNTCKSHLQASYCHKSECKENL